MNKTLALVALLGLVAAPAFASPEAAKPAADKMVKSEAAAKDAAAPAAEEAKKAEDAAKAAPAAGKVEEKKEPAKH